ncbi:MULTISPECIES: DUF1697 domain-containing protein [unclassified Rhizobium]|uniref:DUF1697 domain-containing protein n=1 Tax=unclassified Rhizobium TaxID=2613769 RepID=UPI000DDF0EE3|nr:MULTISPECIES: DUF1697 domain-containing protein [unclassified Rhizobium]MBB3288046.1 uncharacterized protein (DUF1697 family) [Rhizobium sp. BK252]MBB3403091.1 uncharacterized protein (DUF1697 family) [Rhizobium sp. BK289]MBB3415668.1 uncharacterized protein (DUF1697 family) [Rhizobium sp. BK284]MBB3483252.1 uncharacterized protein (DUF1697 family) [Rhizobium sp. BK347]MDK4723884.1 DUF1697 domain-containing protein [Rhizobium sp. CNPSo 3968]
MAVFVALLRAVNVGGTGMLSMADLKTLCEEIGFKDVRTYIQSGNVVFRAEEDEATVQARLETALAAKMGKSPGVILRNREALERAAEHSPFPHAKPNYLLVTFLQDEAPKDALNKLVAPGGEEVRVAGREIYVHYPDGSGRSKLKLPALKAGTSRNLNTVRKLAEMARELEDSGL